MLAFQLLNLVLLDRDFLAFLWPFVHLWLILLPFSINRDSKMYILVKLYFLSVLYALAAGQIDPLRFYSQGEFISKTPIAYKLTGCWFFSVFHWLDFAPQLVFEAAEDDVGDVEDGAFAFGE